MSSDKLPPIDSVIAANVVPRFVQLLARDDNPKLQFESCWALTNIASGTTANTKAVMDAGAVPFFVRLLESPDPDVREQAVWAMGNIAGDSIATRQEVLRNGVIQPLLRCLVPTAKLTFVRNATWTISNLVRGKSTGGIHDPRMEMVRPLLPRLAALIHAEDKEVLTDALWALSYLSDGEEERLHTFLESGCISRVVQLLRHPLPEVVTPALRTVGNIVTGDDAMTQTVLNEGALPLIAQLLTHGRQGIRKEACWLVSNVCAGTQSQIEAVIHANIVPLLIHHITKSEHEVAREACWALSNATTGGSSAQIFRLVKDGVLEPFKHVLGHLRNPQVQTVATEGLENILKHKPPHEFGQPPDLYRQYMEQAEIPQAMDELLRAHNADHPLYKKATRFLETHFPHFGDYEEEEEEDYDQDNGDDEGGAVEALGQLGAVGGGPLVPPQPFNQVGFGGPFVAPAAAPGAGAFGGAPGAGAAFGAPPVPGGAGFQFQGWAPGPQR